MTAHSVARAVTLVLDSWEFSYAICNLSLGACAMTVFVYVYLSNENINICAHTHAQHPPSTCACVLRNEACVLAKGVCVCV